MYATNPKEQCSPIEKVSYSESQPTEIEYDSDDTYCELAEIMLLNKQLDRYEKDKMNTTDIHILENIREYTKDSINNLNPDCSKMDSLEITVGPNNSSLKPYVSVNQPTDLQFNINIDTVPNMVALNNTECTEIEANSGTKSLNIDSIKTCNSKNSFRTSYRSVGLKNASVKSSLNKNMSKPALDVHFNKLRFLPSKCTHEEQRIGRKYRNTNNTKYITSNKTKNCNSLSSFSTNINKISSRKRKFENVGIDRDIDSFYDLRNRINYSINKQKSSSNSESVQVAKKNSSCDTMTVPENNHSFKLKTGKNLPYWSEREFIYGRKYNSYNLRERLCTQNYKEDEFVNINDLRNRVSYKKNTQTNSYKTRNKRTLQNQFSNLRYYSNCSQNISDNTKIKNNRRAESSYNLRTHLPALNYTEYNFDDEDRNLPYNLRKNLQLASCTKYEFGDECSDRTVQNVVENTQSYCGREIKQSHRYSKKLLFTNVKGNNCKDAIGIIKKNICEKIDNKAIRATCHKTTTLVNKCESYLNGYPKNIRLEKTVKYPKELHIPGVKAPSITDNDTIEIYKNLPLGDTSVFKNGVRNKNSVKCIASNQHKTKIQTYLAKQKNVLTKQKIPRRKKSKQMDNDYESSSISMKPKVGQMNIENYDLIDPTLSISDVSKLKRFKETACESLVSENVKRNVENKDIGMETEKTSNDNRIKNIIVGCSNKRITNNNDEIEGNCNQMVITDDKPSCDANRTKIKGKGEFSSFKEISFCKTSNLKQTAPNKIKQINAPIRAEGRISSNGNQKIPNVMNYDENVDIQSYRYDNNGIKSNLSDQKMLQLISQTNSFDSRNMLYDCEKIQQSDNVKPPTQILKYNKSRVLTSSKISGIFGSGQINKIDINGENKIHKPVLHLVCDNDCLIRDTNFDGTTEVIKPLNKGLNPPMSNTSYSNINSSDMLVTAKPELKRTLADNLFVINSEDIACLISEQSETLVSLNNMQIDTTERVVNITTKTGNVNVNNDRNIVYRHLGDKNDKLNLSILDTTLLDKNDHDDTSLALISDNTFESTESKVDTTIIYEKPQILALLNHIKSEMTKLASSENDGIYSQNRNIIEENIEKSTNFNDKKQSDRKLINQFLSIEDISENASQTNDTRLIISEFLNINNMPKNKNDNIRNIADSSHNWTSISWKNDNGISEKHDASVSSSNRFDTHMTSVLVDKEKPLIRKQLETQLYSINETNDTKLYDIPFTRETNVNNIIDANICEESGVDKNKALNDKELEILSLPDKRTEIENYTENLQTLTSHSESKRKYENNNKRVPEVNLPYANACASAYGTRVIDTSDVSQTIEPGSLLPYKNKLSRIKKEKKENIPHTCFICPDTLKSQISRKKKVKNNSKKISPRLPIEYETIKTECKSGALNLNQIDVTKSDINKVTYLCSKNITISSVEQSNSVKTKQLKKYSQIKYPKKSKETRSKTHTRLKPPYNAKSTPILNVQISQDMESIITNVGALSLINKETTLLPKDEDITTNIEAEWERRNELEYFNLNDLCNLFTNQLTFPISQVNTFKGANTEKDGVKIDNSISLKLPTYCQEYCDLNLDSLVNHAAVLNIQSLIRNIKFIARTPPYYIPMNCNRIDHKCDDFDLWFN